MHLIRRDLNLGNLTVIARIFSHLFIEEHDFNIFEMKQPQWGRGPNSKIQPILQQKISAVFLWQKIFHISTKVISSKNKEQMVPACRAIYFKDEPVRKKETKTICVPQWWHTYWSMLRKEILWAKSSYQDCKPNKTQTVGLHIRWQTYIFEGKWPRSPFPYSGTFQTTWSTKISLWKWLLISTKTIVVCDKLYEQYSWCMSSHKNILERETALCDVTKYFRKFVKLRQTKCISKWDLLGAAHIHDVLDDDSLQTWPSLILNEKERL